MFMHRIAWSLLSTEPDSAWKIHLLKVADVTGGGGDVRIAPRARRGNVMFVYT
jgi:hypothetical protein